MLKVVAKADWVESGPVSLAWRSKMEVTLKLIPRLPGSTTADEDGNPPSQLVRSFTESRVTAANDNGTSAELTYGVHSGIAVLKVFRQCVSVSIMVETSPSLET